jgi:hypothetical protein
MIMIIVAHCQHGGSFLILSWDPRILVADSSTTATAERDSF